MRYAIDFLDRAVTDGRDLEARTGVMLSSYLGGFCIGQKGVDGIHGLCTPIESMNNAVHGHVLGTILPHMLRFNMETLAPKYAMAARRLGLTNSSDDATACGAIFDAAMKLQSLTGCPDTIAGYGLGAGDIPKLTEMALLSQATHRNGRLMTADNIPPIYEAML